MLTENQVVEAIKQFLVGKGYEILSSSTTTQHGDDIVAVQRVTGIKLYVEAKGETSSQSTTARYGKPFDRGQVLSHVSRAFYRASALHQQRLGQEIRRVGIALPDTPLHRERIDAIRLALDKLEIAVFWVSSQHTVSVTSTWL